MAAPGPVGAGAAAAVGGAGAPAPAPAPVAAPAAAAPTLGDYMWSVMNDLLVILGIRREDIPTPTTLEGISRLVRSRPTRYIPPGWLSALETMARGTDSMVAVPSKSELIMNINAAKAAGESAHRSGFKVLNSFLIFRTIYSREDKRTPLNPEYRDARKDLIKSILEYIILTRNKFRSRQRLREIARANDIDPDEFSKESSTETANRNRIPIPHMPWQLSQVLNEFVTQLSDEERTASMLTPGQGLRELSQPPIIEGLGDIDTMSDADFDARLNPVRAYLATLDITPDMSKSKLDKPPAGSRPPALLTLAKGSKPPPSGGQPPGTSYTSQIRKLFGRSTGAGAGAGANMAANAARRVAIAASSSGAAGAASGPGAEEINVAGILAGFSGAEAGGGGGGNMDGSLNHSGGARRTRRRRSTHRRINKRPAARKTRVHRRRHHATRKRKH